MKTNLRITRSLAALLGAASLALLLAAPATAGNWRFSVTPYAWATNVGVKANVKGSTVVDETISVSDLMEDLDTIFMGRFEASYKSYGVMIDAFDVTLSDEATGLLLPQGAGTADLGTEMGMTIVDVAATYRMSEKPIFTAYGGARIVNERATIDATFYTPGAPVSQTWEPNDTYVDGLVGMRFTTPLSRHFSTTAQADVSTGGTDYTWSIAPVLTYSFGDMNRFGVNAGWKRMQIDFADSDGVDSQLTLSGAVLGFRVSF